MPVGPAPATGLLALVVRGRCPVDFRGGASNSMFTHAYAHVHECIATFLGVELVIGTHRNRAARPHQLRCCVAAHTTYPVVLCRCGCAVYDVCSCVYGLWVNTYMVSVIDVHNRGCGLCNIGNSV